MSSNSLYVHPDIRLVAASDDSEQEIHTYSEKKVRDPREFHRFNDLPANVQADIFRRWLCMDRRLVHCLSRLDPFQAPPAMPPSRSGLLNRFYWGEERDCNITQDTHDPQDILRLLLVCKSFYFKGVHAFYGTNTFAFSSLGEFHRFCKGIGAARTARLQHIEMTWMGNQYLTIKPDEKGRWFSKRTSALTHLLEMSRLLTMVIFVNESQPGHNRRNYEPPQVQKNLGLKTLGQPIERLSRNLRTVQGLDYIHALRGLGWIHFYDLWPALKQGGGRFPIHDASFAADVNSTVTMPKAPPAAEKAQLKNLVSVFKPQRPAGGDDSSDGSSSPESQSGSAWAPSDADWELVGKFYDEAAKENPFNATRHYYGVADEYASRPAEADDADDDEEEEEDNEEEDNEEEDSEEEDSEEGEGENENDSENNKEQASNGGDDEVEDSRESDEESGLFVSDDESESNLLVGEEEYALVISDDEPDLSGPDNDSRSDTHDIRKDSRDKHLDRFSRRSSEAPSRVASDSDLQTAGQDPPRHPSEARSLATTDPGPVTVCEDPPAAVENHPHFRCRASETPSLAASEPGINENPHVVARGGRSMTVPIHRWIGSSEAGSVANSRSTSPAYHDGRFVMPGREAPATGRSQPTSPLYQSIESPESAADTPSPSPSQVPPKRPNVDQEGPDPKRQKKGNTSPGSHCPLS